MDNILESAIFADRRPSVALVFADSSITDADFDAGKEAAVVTAVGHAADKVLSDEGPVYDDPSKPGENLKEYIVNGALGDYVSVKNGQWIVRRSEIDWCDED